MEAALRALSSRAFERLTLKDLGTKLGVSPYHLCRSFREVTGVRLHRYRHRLRLAASLNAIEAGGDLSRIALDLGYSSHSHFTAAFRAAFGVPPSSAR